MPLTMTLLGAVTRCANCATTTLRRSPHPVLNTERFAAIWIWTVPSAMTEQTTAGLMNGTVVRNNAIATAATPSMINGQDGSRKRLKYHVSNTSHAQ